MRGCPTETLAHLRSSSRPHSNESWPRELRSRWQGLLLLERSWLPKRLLKPQKQKLQRPYRTTGGGDALAANPQSSHWPVAICIRLILVVAGVVTQALDTGVAVRRSREKIRKNMAQIWLMLVRSGEPVALDEKTVCCHLVVA